MAIRAPKNILIAPLDWGAGHTTRCVPLIQHLLEQGHNPIVAGNTAQLAFIKETYPAISTVYLEGYNITYSGWNRVAQAGLLMQMPGILRAIKQEHQWLQHTAKELKIDGVISDNRYGLHHSTIPSVILTHQLHIMSGMGSAVDNMVQRMHYKYLNRFSATWVVDTEKEPSLAGALSHSSKMPAQYKYIGLLSRFAEKNQAVASDKSLLILLSGPEPQRIHLSRLLWEQALRYSGKIIFAEGSDNAIAPAEIPAHISYHKRLGNDALAHTLQEVDMVICRSGYSTIMDLVATKKRAILIPTPGQTEQEYLGKYLHEKGMFYSTPQSGFDLNNTIAAASSFPFKPFNADGAYEMYRKVLAEWLLTL